jgi:filamentous hemagglutinin
LRVGEALRSPDGQWIAVEGVRDTGRAEVVYNCRVAEYHTYFVGVEGWSFSAWAHNSCGPTDGAARVPLRGNLTGSLDNLSVAEREAVEYLLSQGRNVEIIPTAANRTPDFRVDGILTELKTISGVANQTSDGLSAAMANRIMDGRGQASHILVDVRGQPGMTQEIAERGVRRAYGADNRSGARIQSIRIIGNGFDFTVRRMP